MCAPLPLNCLTASLTAKVTDTLNASTTSSPITVTVNIGIAPAYYIHADHLDSPRQITDTAGNVVWEWQNTDPFGSNVPNENPTGQGTFNFNLRFPGQYADKETNTHYNINRDYDPNLGRYIESDPIGLNGGVNTYIYVGGDPVSRIDPDGLDWFRPWSDQSSTYFVGRPGNWFVPPGGIISKGIEHCVPAGRSFGQIHDQLLDENIAKGESDLWANVPSMPRAYVRAVKQEMLNSQNKLENVIRNLYGMPGSL